MGDVDPVLVEWPDTSWISLLLLSFILPTPSPSTFPDIKRLFEVKTWRAPFPPPLLWLFAATLNVTFLWMAAAASAPHPLTGAGLLRARRRQRAAGGRLDWDLWSCWRSCFYSEDLLWTLIFLKSCCSHGTFMLIRYPKLTMINSPHL